MRRTIELDNAVAAELAGSEDRILRALDGHLGCDVFLRGNVLTLDGEAAAVQSGATVVAELADLVAQGHQLGPGTIDAVTSALDQHHSPSEILEDVVWRHRNLKVAPKTVNQKRYVDSIRRNTVTFGIGPAGTGKTFLAVACAVDALERQGVQRIEMRKDECVEIVGRGAAMHRIHGRRIQDGHTASGGNACARDGRRSVREDSEPSERASARATVSSSACGRVDGIHRARRQIDVEARERGGCC